MSQTLDGLIKDPIIKYFALAVCSILITIIVIAFFQGREILFWPPGIGERPEKTVLSIHK